MNTPPKIFTGTDDFAKLRHKSDVYVDKSLFIKEFIEKGDEAMLITRPRRWGKSLNMDMLARFLAIETDERGQPLPLEQCTNRPLFLGGEVMLENGEKKQLQPLNIAEHPRLIDLYQGKAPVISLGLKNVKGYNYQEIEGKIRQVLSSLFKQHIYLINNQCASDHEQTIFKHYLDEKASRPDLTRSLAFLSELLHRHFQKKVYILVDEYDAPINHAYQKFRGDATSFDSVLELFSELFSAAFKTNPYLNRGVITGILRIAKGNIFSDLNNVREYTLLDDHFATSYGFTQAEVDTLLTQIPTKTRAEQIKAWYNGYTFGDQLLYNPWSMMCCLSEQGKLAPYWIDSGGTSLIDDKLTEYSVQAALQQLVQGQSIDTPIITQISFEDLQKTSGLLSLLLFGGYLNPVRKLEDAKNPVYELSIPNHEVQYIYELRLLDWVSQQLDIDSDGYFNFVRFLAKGQLDDFEESLQDYLHNTTSFHQTGRKSGELFYHGFMLCLISTLRTYYHIQSEQEGLRGRSDTLLIPKPYHGTEALVVEYKVTQEADNLAAVAQAGVDQIVQKGYAQPAKQYDHVKSARALCIAFCGKEVAMAHEVVPIA